MKSRSLFLSIFAALLLALSLQPAGAAEEDGWELSFGGGALGGSVYPGSSDLYVTPFPAVGVSYTQGSLSLGASLLEGLYASYFNEVSGIIGNALVSGGDSRDSDEYSAFFFKREHSSGTKDLLTGTGSVSTPVFGSLSLGSLTPIGIVMGTVAYHPTTVEGEGTESEFYNGFQFSAQYVIGAPLSERLTLMGVLSVGFMNSAYADAWYDLAEGTTQLESFDADGGIRDTGLVLELSYAVSDDLSVTALSANTLLLGDAAKSPFTDQRFQPTLMVYTLYSF